MSKNYSGFFINSECIFKINHTDVNEEIILIEEIILEDGSMFYFIELNNTQNIIRNSCEINEKEYKEIKQKYFIHTTIYFVSGYKIGKAITDVKLLSLKDQLQEPLTLEEDVKEFIEYTTDGEIKWEDLTNLEKAQEIILYIFDHENYTCNFYMTYELASKVYHKLVKRNE